MRLFIFFYVFFSHMRGSCGRFAQARGNSAWARQFNFQASSQRFFRPHIRTMCSINLTQCLGEVPLSGFAEQYSSITQSFNSVGQSSGNNDATAGDNDDLLDCQATDEMMEFVQIAEVPTLCTYNGHNWRASSIGFRD